MKIANIAFNSEFNATVDLITAVRTRSKQACIAILVNASEAIVENGIIVLRTSNVDADHIKLEIIDNGIGIDPEDQVHILNHSSQQNRNQAELAWAWLSFMELSKAIKEKSK